MLVATTSQSAMPSPNTGGTVPNQGSDDDAGLFSLSRLQRQFTAYLTDKDEEIEEAKDARRVYHGVQWTAEEIRKLRDRGQPPTFYNKVARKVDGIVGISEKNRQDPKAYPRNPRDEDGAAVATCVVRYVMERNEWTSKKPHALRQALTDGIAGVEFRLVKGDHGDPDIEIAAVDTEDFFYDPASVRPNFTDARYMGLSKWLDIDEAAEMFPDREDEIRAQGEGAGSQYATDNDRDNRWHRRAQHRIRLVEHWYISRRDWCWAFYIGSEILAEGVSPFFDERGDTMCRFQMFSAITDHDGDRYGIIRNLIPIQQEINQRASILLRLALTRRVISERGAVDDVEVARREWARPDGWVEVNPGRKIEPDNTTQQVAEHTALLQMAINEMEAFYNINPAALAGPQAKNLSGKAVNLLQAPGLAELVMLFINYRNWIIRCYRMAWNMAQRFWTAERWLRVSDDQGVAQHFKVNELTFDRYGHPAIANKLGAMDIDLILDEGPDVQNMMQDSLETLAQFLPALPPGSIPMDILVSLMPIPSALKQKWEDRIEKAQQPDPMRQQAQKIALVQESAKIDETVAGTALKHAQALSALGSAAHKTQEAHIDGARVFAGGLQQIDGAPQNQAAAQAMQQPQQGPAQPQPGLAVPPTQLGPNLPMIPGAAPNLNAALGGNPPPMPASNPMPGIAPVPGPMPSPLAAAPPIPATVAAPPLGGAAVAPDGHVYVHAPHAGGRFRRVVRRG